MNRCIHKVILFLMTCLLLCIFTACKSKDEISINGMTLGKKVTSKIKECTVMDAEFRYEYNNVGINIDEKDCIEYLDYYCVTTLSDDETGFEDATIIYKGNQFETLEEMVSYFETNNQMENPEDEPEADRHEDISGGGKNWESYYYADDICKVRIRYYKGEFSGIRIEYK